MVRKQLHPVAIVVLPIAGLAERRGFLDTGVGRARAGGAMWDAGLKLPTQTRDDRARCFCGAEITNKTVEDHIAATHAGPVEA